MKFINSNKSISESKALTTIFWMSMDSLWTPGHNVLDGDTEIRIQSQKFGETFFTILSLLGTIETVSNESMTFQVPMNIGFFKTFNTLEKLKFHT